MPHPVRRRRILRVITRLNIGGPAIHASLLSSRLDSSRYETLLVSGREGAREGRMIELGRLDPGLRPRLVPHLVRPLSPLADLRSLLALAHIAVAYRPDIIHSHLAKAGFVGRLASIPSRPRAVLHTYHGSVFDGYFGPRETFVYLTIERLLARLTTRIVAITPGQRGELIRLGIGDARKVVVIPLGLDLEPFLTDIEVVPARAAIGLRPSSRVVGLVGRLVPIKDVGTFLRAIAELAPAMPDLEAVIVGDGPERGSLESLSRDLGLDRLCHFVGWRSDMAAVYAALDVVALSSLNEGSPVSLIEAMAAGRAVVGTRVGGVPEVIRDGATGVLVSPSDPPALARALAGLLDDPDARRKLGNDARDEARERWTAARLLRDIERLYDDLLVSGDARPG